MLKKIALTIALSLIYGSAMAQLTEPYVRKKLEPNFFIPEGALAASQPEKLALPQYRQGTSTAKHISKNAPDITPLTNTDLPISQPQTTASTTPLPQEEQSLAVSDSSSTTDSGNFAAPTPAPSVAATDSAPNYQKMYQEYLQDLESITNSGEADTTHIDADLQQMNTEERIKIDQNFNQRRNVQEDIRKALE